MRRSRILTLFIVTVFLASSISLSNRATAGLPPPFSEWEISGPLSPIGFLSMEQREEATGNIYEFMLMNGTSASISLIVTPSEYASEFPLILNLFLSGRAVDDWGREMEDVSVTFSQNPVILKSADDQVLLNVTLTANEDASNEVYEMRFGRRFEGGGETFSRSFYLRIINGPRLTIIKLVTVTTTSSTTIRQTYSTTVTVTSQVTETKTAVFTTYTETRVIPQDWVGSIQSSSIGIGIAVAGIVIAYAIFRRGGDVVKVS